MARSRTTFVCRQCGGVHAKWMGKCPDCGAWDSLEEVRETVGAASWAAEPAAALQAELTGQAAEAPKARPLGRIESLEVPRIRTRIGEFDRVLGGGFVPGSVVLVGGEPGIGKSTLLLQSAASVAAGGERVLYVTSEESAQQVQLRSERLELPDAGDRLFVLADTNLARIFEQVRRVKPRLLIVDSIQMVHKSDLDASMGGVTQLRRCAMEVVHLAKASGMAVVLVGHVTKEGNVAGPRLLEHLVDAVLYFEGDRYHSYRIVRGVKNRYGTTLEIGLFEMQGAGLREVTDAMGVLDRHREARPGSVACPAMAGSRCFVVEIQALTAPSVPGAAKRKVAGLDANRLAMLVAVLERHGGLRLGDQDIFASAVGGLKLVEPATDLAVCLAIAGAHTGRSLDLETVAVGEVGLGSEVRAAPQMEQRLREAARLGFRRVLVPEGTASRVQGLEVQPVRRLAEAMEALG